MRLELRGVTAGYGSTTVLRDVDLTVPSGRVVALLGPNGAGKTTLLSVASGLVAPTAGAVVLDGLPITSLPPHERIGRGLCHITEGRSVFPSLDVEDNLRMFAPAAARRAVLERAVTSSPVLGRKLRQRAGTLSGGEQQLLALARIHGQDAPVVLLDEVSMGLAPLLVDEVLDHLRRLAAEGRTLLLVEQYVGKALALADLVYVLVRGRVVFAGEPSELRGSELLAHYLGDAG